MKQKKILIIIISIILLVLAAYGVNKLYQMSQKKALVGKWYHENSEVIEFKADKTLVIYSEKFAEDLTMGDGIYYFPLNDRLRIEQDVLSIEFSYKIKKNTLILKLTGNETIELKKK